MLIAPGLNYDKRLGLMDYWISGFMGLNMTPSIRSSINPVIRIFQAALNIYGMMKQTRI
jgi:hypothetical protein